MQLVQCATLDNPHGPLRVTVPTDFKIYDGTYDTGRDACPHASMRRVQRSTIDGRHGQVRVPVPTDFKIYDGTYDTGRDACPHASMRRVQRSTIDGRHGQVRVTVPTKVLKIRGLQLINNPKTEAYFVHRGSTVWPLGRGWKSPHS